MDLAKDSTQETEAKKSIQQLLDFLGPILAYSVKAIALTNDTGTVSFKDIWQIFPTGELVKTTFFEAEALCRVTKYGRNEPRDLQKADSYWRIDLRYIDWNGEHCGYTSTSVAIKYFSGKQNFNSLPVYPLNFDASPKEIKERVIERGRMFESLRGYHFRNCNGVEILMNGSGEERPVSGRVIIDAYAYYHPMKWQRPTVKPLETEKRAANKDKNNDEDDNVGSGYNGRSRISRYDSESERERRLSPRVVERRRPISSLRPSSNVIRYDRSRPLSASPVYRCRFSPESRSRSRSPGSVRVFTNRTRVVDNGPEMAITNSLAKATERREVLDTLADDQCLLTTPRVIGLTKLWGRAIIILMFGPPGVGKTYTAESVAEPALVPLYNVSAATLGSRPADVERTLEQSLDLCKLWNAMLLLDEADVFVSARSDSDLIRNELVAIFLTKLEYYQGICFMTTNRMASLDHALQSRVDLFLRYADLTITARREFWQNFVKKIGAEKFSVTGDNLDELAKHDLNG